jgi:hypothetical protein
MFLTCPRGAASLLLAAGATLTIRRRALLVPPETVSATLASEPLPSATERAFEATAPCPSASAVGACLGEATKCRRAIRSGLRVGANCGAGEGCMNPTEVPKSAVALFCPIAIDRNPLAFAPGKPPSSPPLDAHIGRATQVDGQAAQRDDGGGARPHDDAGVVFAGAAGGGVDDGLDPIRDDADRLGDGQRAEVARGQDVDRAVAIGLVVRELKGPARCRSWAGARIGAGSRDLGFVCCLRSSGAAQ